MRVIHKNVVIKRIAEIKELKSKPGLKEAIQITMGRKAEKDEKARKKLKSKVMALYEKEISAVLNEEDKRFTRVLLQIDRLHKILTS